MPLTARDARAPLAALVASVVLATAAACSAPPAQAPGDESTASTPTYTVTTRDITSVIVVDGNVEASPVAVVAAPQAGRVAYVSASLGASSLDSGAVLARVADIDVVMPFPGRVTAASYPSGAQVPANAAIATVAYAGYGIVASIPSELVLRVYTQPTGATAAVTGGPGGIPCSLHPTAAPPDADTGSISVVCMLPADSAVVAGLPAKIGIETGRREAVLAVPVTAVLGEVQNGMVTVVRDGERVVTSVELGVSDGSFVEVLAGLDEGDRILINAPGLR